MSNYKIRVNSKAESKEAQQLFFELGYEKGVCSTGGYPALIIATPESRFQKTPYSSRATSLNHEAHSQYKEITLPGLRDLVVLKRNDREDANVSEENCLYDLYLTESRELYFYHCSKNKWILSNLNGDDDYYESLKPIEKPMKEYLIKSGDGKYLLTHHDSIGAIEIPEGAECLTQCGEFKAFWKDGAVKFLNCDNDWDFKFGMGVDRYIELARENGCVIIWSRHTHPEELPFVDDEPKIETATGYQLDVVGSNTYGSRSRYDGESDISYRQYLMNFIVGNRTESLNDQYAEIEKVRQTLKTRQSQYGSFEDVAMITEQMVDIMRKGYYENLAYNQKMALYMICSKMARIVNGNPNHKDSWHDIAGYATLIDNELVSEKDMPF